MYVWQQVAYLDYSKWLIQYVLTQHTIQWKTITVLLNKNEVVLVWLVLGLSNFMHITKLYLDLWQRSKYNYDKAYKKHNNQN